MSTAAPDQAVCELPQPEWDAPRCEQCQAPSKPGRVAVCPCCGWYGSLGIFVEVDPHEAHEARTGAAPVAAPASVWQVWSSLIPAWGWAIIATQVAILAGSIAVRLCVPTDTMLYAWWGSAQLLVALGVLLVAHFTAFVITSANDVDMGVADLIVKPLKAWLRQAAELPRRLTLINTGISSITAALCAALVIGGIPWYVLLDWKFKQPPKKNLMAAVMSQAQNLKGDDKNLDEAIQDFAGNGVAGDDKSKDKSNKQPEPATPREKAECVIFGYNVSETGQITSLLLASEHRGKLVYAGQVRPSLSDDESRKLLDQLSSAPMSTPFVPTGRTAKWVTPRVTCRVTFAKRVETGVLTKIEWDALMGELRLPWGN